VDVDEWPEIQYTSVGDDDVAFAVFGEGPVDLVFFAGLGSHVDLASDDPGAVRLLSRLASFSRVIFFNRRGTGLSDGIGRGGLPTWEDWTDDLEAVLDAAGSSSASVLAMVDAGPVAIQFAATRPHRVRSLVLANTTARFRRDVDHEIGMGDDQIDAIVEMVASTWGTERFAAGASSGSADAAESARSIARQLRACATPRMAAAQFRYFLNGVDARQALPLLTCPTLILHNRHNPFLPLAHGRALEAGTPDARLVELPGGGATLNGELIDVVVDEVARFVTGAAPPSTDHDRVLATIMFSDIVGSTQLLSRIGDDEWRRALDRHDRVVRQQLARFGGREVKTTGDGFLVAFDGPGRAMRCAKAMTAATAAIGVPIRVGIHTGECEVRGDDLAGVAVHVAARVTGLAGASEVLVTSLAAELTTGSELTFEARGTHELRGVGGSWSLHALQD
jgi:class 3 adenylate cyclase